MKKKYICLIFLGVITLGCNSRYGFFYNHERHALSGHLINIEKDSTFKWIFWTEWYSRNSFGTWKMIPNKKNTILLKSSSSDYTHIPIYVKAYHQEQNGTTIIFSQGKQFYNCEFNELLVNDKIIFIDQDTILIPECHVDSLSLRLRYSDDGKQQRPWILYNEILSDKYYSLDAQNNVFELSLPVYPHYEDSYAFYPRASTLFSYLPMETEAIFCNGTWYMIGRNGKTTLPFRRHRKRRGR